MSLTQYRRLDFSGKQQKTEKNRYIQNFDKSYEDFLCFAMLGLSTHTYNTYLVLLNKVVDINYKKNIA